MRLRTSLATFSVLLPAVLGLWACGLAEESDTSEYRCKHPTPSVDGVDTGYVTCEAGWMHRATITECPSELPRPGYTCQSQSPGSDTCTTDADCAGTPHGYCFAGEFLSCSCHEGCRTDADCPTANVCMCGGVIGRCVPATCMQDADCPGGNLCASYDAHPSCGATQFACQTKDDQCADNSDCSSGACTVKDGRRVCVKVGCII